MYNDNKVLKNVMPNRISENLIEKVERLSTSLLSDAMDSFGVMKCDIRPISPGMRVIGTAITVKVRPGDNLFLHKAIYLAGKGYVLVLDSGEHKTSAVWGDMMTRGAIAMGLEGAVLDGAVRDLAVLRDLGFPIFANGIIPNGMSRNGPGLINCDISCGGVSVSPGDLVFGDDDGVVIVPSNILEIVISLAEKKQEQELIRIKEIEQGLLEPDWIDKNILKISI